MNMHRAGMFLLTITCALAPCLVEACEGGSDVQVSLDRSSRSPVKANQKGSPDATLSECWRSLDDPGFALDDAVLVDVRPTHEQQNGLVEGALHARADDWRIAVMFPQQVVLLFGTGKNDQDLVAHCQAQRQMGSSNVFVLAGGIRALTAMGGHVRRSARPSEEHVTLNARELRGIAQNFHSQMYVVGPGGESREWTEILGADVEEWRGQAHNDDIGRSGFSAVLLLPQNLDLKSWRIRHGLSERHDILYYTEGVDAYQESERQDRLIAEHAYRPLSSGCGRN